MLLGEHNFGFTARGRTVIAFDTSSAHERWRWEARNSDATPYMALADDSLVVRDGKHYKIIKDGRALAKIVRQNPHSVRITKTKPALCGAASV